MKSLANELSSLIIEERGRKGFLRNISDPHWFQAFGCILGFDWHSSGLTTVVTGVLKDVLRPERHGIVVAGGKGMASRNTKDEIITKGLELGVSTVRLKELQYASRICAKVDNSAIQAGYPLYHHAFFFTEDGSWAIVQQGMNEKDGTARRYHWLSEHVNDYVVEPHDAIVGDLKREHVLNMTATEAEENRKTCVDLVRQDPNGLISSIRAMSPRTTLEKWTGHLLQNVDITAYEMPTDLNWKVFFDLYDIQPRSYEELLALRGVGPATVRALALVSQLVYGKPASWKDPVKFSFAHGGKDGVPFPVDRATMERTTEYLKGIVQGAEMERSLKIDALKRLCWLSREWGL
jgi:hypothetical protein